MNKPVNFESKIEQLNIYVDSVKYTIHIDTEDMNTIMLMSTNPYYCFLTFPFNTPTTNESEYVKVKFAKIGNGRKYDGKRTIFHRMYPNDIQTLQSFIQWLYGILNESLVKQRLNP